MRQRKRANKRDARRRLAVLLLSIIIIIVTGIVFRKIHSQADRRGRRTVLRDANKTVSFVVELVFERYHDALEVFAS